MYVCIFSAVLLSTSCYFTYFVFTAWLSPQLMGTPLQLSSFISASNTRRPCNTSKLLHYVVSLIFFPFGASPRLSDLLVSFAFASRGRILGAYLRSPGAVIGFSKSHRRESHRAARLIGFAMLLYDDLLGSSSHHPYPGFGILTSRFCGETYRDLSGNAS